MIIIAILNCFDDLQIVTNSVYYYNRDFINKRKFL